MIYESKVPASSVTNLEELFSGPAMISYAQNREDVMVYRALKALGKGTYIDVGAGDPVNDSVTKYFYDQGWSGINIEPHPVRFQALKEQRTRDINLQSVLSDCVKECEFYHFEHTDFSTYNSGVAATHESNKHQFVTHKVETTTLDIIFEQHIGDRDVHLLKIDVEGSEKQVLQGINLLTHRPWILIVESTVPNTQIENFQEWEALILQSGYEFVYKDGLNRFYLSNDHRDLKICFELPPNVFDHYEQFYPHRNAEITQIKKENQELRKKMQAMIDEKGTK